MPIASYSCEGTLTIGGISMNRAAWACVGDERGTNGLFQLWADFDVRGDDRVLPGAGGVIAYRRRITATRADLRLLVVGDVDETGGTNPDPVIGLENNLEYIRANVLAPVATTSGTRAAVLTMPSGATRTADIHVLGAVTQTYSIAGGGALWLGTLQISIPSGRFS